MSNRHIQVQPRTESKQRGIFTHSHKALHPIQVLFVNYFDSLSVVILLFSGRRAIAPSSSLCLTAILAFSCPLQTN